MAKAKTHYTCQACGYKTAKWLGKCPDCGAWSSLLEENEAKVDEKRPAWGASGGASKPVRLKEVSGEVEARRRTGIRSREIALDFACQRKERSLARGFSNEGSFSFI